MGQMALKRTSVALCITRAQFKLTARPWFLVLNSHQEQYAYPGFVAQLVIKILRLVGFHQMHCCIDRSGISHHARETRAHCPTMVSSFKHSLVTILFRDFLRLLLMQQLMHLEEAHKF